MKDLSLDDKSEHFACWWSRVQNPLSSTHKMYSNGRYAYVLKNDLNLDDKSEHFRDLTMIPDILAHRRNLALTPTFMHISCGSTMSQTAPERQYISNHWKIGIYSLFYFFQWGFYVIYKHKNVCSSYFLRVGNNLKCATKIFIEYICM